MKSLKQKTVSGLTWSFIDNISKQIITFIIGIILARLLAPQEFGLIGMLTIFIAISQSLINSGFTQALIRKKDCTQTDYSTVFYFNLVLGVFFYFILFCSAESISRFFNEPQLKLILRILGIVLIFNSVAIIQRARLTKRIDFKLQAKISFLSSISSGIIAIFMAYSGYGVWSLVVKTITWYAFTSLLLWLWNKWKPTLEFSLVSFKDLFSFGSKLMVSGLINTAYLNVYYLIIGKYFSATELGYYTRADHFNNLTSQNINTVVQRVSYPILSSIQEDVPRLKQAYRNLIQSTMFITFILSMGMAAIAEPLIITLIGTKWLHSVIYLQLLCFVGMFYPLQALNLNMLNVVGRSDLFLRLEIIKKTLAVPNIIIGIMFGIKIMIIGMIINSIIAYYLNSYWSGKFIGYSIAQQIQDIYPTFLFAAIVGGTVFLFGWLLEVNYGMKLFLQISIGMLLVISLSEIFQLKEYLYIKEIILNKIKNEG